MVATLIAIQAAGLLFLYWLLARRIARASDVSGHLAALRAEVGGLVAELNGTTERNVTLLEDRISVVNDLLTSVDRRIRVLGTESARYEAKVMAMPAAPGPADPAIPKGAPAAPRAASDPPPAERHAGAAEDRSEQMLRLHRSGLGPEQIAERLGANVGEVELVIGLASRAG